MSEDRHSGFRRAVEAGDHAAMVAALSEDVEFRSPVVFKPYRGRDVVAVLFAAVLETFRGFRYTAELHGEDRVGLVFQARVGEREVEGWDHLHFDADGLIDEFVVMVRPMSGVHALAEAMKARLEAAGAL